jgi:hypothetical protein
VRETIRFAVTTRAFQGAPIPLPGSISLMVRRLGRLTSNGSGAAASPMVFASEDPCSPAAAQIGGSGNIGSEKGGPYQIIAKCIARSVSGAPAAADKGSREALK